MKNIISAIVLFLTFTTIGKAQEKKSYQIENAMVKATYYYDNGIISQQGFYKDGKPHGNWNQFDREGNKIASAHYNNGKKEGKWLFWNTDKLSEVDYSSGRIVNINQWKGKERIELTN